MKKYTIKTDRSKFSNEEIAANKNFGKVLSAVQKAKPFYKTGKFFLTIAAAGGIVAVALLIDKTRDESNSPQAAVPFVNPPIKDVNVAFTTFGVEAVKGAELTYKTGSVLHVPANAFIDSSGKSVSGEVQLHYREFRDPVDFFVSGIPMTYDSAGTQYHFESAGMIELLAFQNGKKVFVNPEAKIKVDLYSVQEGNQYNTYYLDTVKHKWNYIAEDTAHALVVTDKKDLTVATPLFPEGSFDIIPPTPVKASKNNYKIKMDFDSLEFPELMTYKGIKFEVSEKNKDFNPDWKKTEWESVKIVKGSLENEYLTTFARFGEKHTFIVYPVWEGDDFKNALKLHEQYLAGVKGREDKLSKSQRKLDSANARNNTDMLFNNNLAASLFASGIRVENTEGIVRRTFEISGFGIYNSDCPSNLPRGKQMIASFTDSIKSKYHLEHVYLVEKGRNAMFTYYETGKFRYNPIKQNIIWSLSPKNEIMLFSSRDFTNAKRIKVKGDSCTFEMRLMPVKTKDPAELKRMLGV